MNHNLQLLYQYAIYAETYLYKLFNHEYNKTAYSDTKWIALTSNELFIFAFLRRDVIAYYVTPFMT
jgi:hypothetical protein